MNDSKIRDKAYKEYNKVVEKSYSFKTSVLDFFQDSWN